MKKLSTILTEIGIYVIFLLLAIFSFTFEAGAQVKKDAAGNYYAEKTTRSDSTGAKPTGKTFTTAKGETFPVMISKNGKLFVIRVSKSGNKYNYYLKLN